MSDQDIGFENITVRVGPETYLGDLDAVRGKVCWIIRQEGYGHSFQNMFMRSSNPIISEASRLDDGRIYLYIEGSGYVYMSHGTITVWEDN